ncbi:MAG TPA: hypothetical protein VN622_05830 [Clostridia bacterium]|nr:hypothetical protein [Clostridia bacterium]
MDTLAQIIRTKRDPAFVPKAVLLWAESGGWRTAESRLKQLVIPLAPILSSSDLDKIADAFSSNSEISDAAGTADGLLELLENSQNPKQAEAAWAQIYNMLNNHEYYAEGRGANLREALETRFGFTSASE